MPIEVQDKTTDAHALRLGKLVSNLLSLEFLIRAYFANQPNAKPVSKYGESVYTNQVGSIIPDSPLTEHVYLTNLVNRFNERQAKNNLPQVDTRIVDLRNALAHGLVSAPMENETMHLIKFIKHGNGTVRVEANFAMTEEWFESQIHMTMTALSVVGDAIPH